MAASVIVDFSQSTNIRTHTGGLRVPVVVPPRSEMIVAHAAPDDAAQPWSVRTVVTAQG